MHIFRVCILSLKETHLLRKLRFRLAKYRQDEIKFFKLILLYVIGDVSDDKHMSFVLQMPVCGCALARCMFTCAMAIADWLYCSVVTYGN